jgi:hypothetical protein
MAALESVVGENEPLTWHPNYVERAGKDRL